jgi:hypothetical protein
LGLYLYADAGDPGVRTVNEYANVQVVEVSALPSFTLLSDPTVQPSPAMQLVVFHSSFSPEWQASIGGTHVLVDGMLNGWLIPAGSHQFSAYYKPANAFSAAQWISLVAVAATLVVCVLFLIVGLVGRYRGTRSSGLWRT